MADIILPPQLVDRATLLSGTTLLNTDLGLSGVQTKLHLPVGGTAEVSILLNMTFETVTEQIRNEFGNNSMILFAGCDLLSDTDTWENCATLVPYRSDAPSTQVALDPHTELYCVEDKGIDVTVSYKDRILSFKSLSPAYYFYSLVSDALEELHIESDPSNYNLIYGGKQVDLYNSLFGYHIPNNAQFTLTLSHTPLTERLHGLQYEQNQSPRQFLTHPFTSGQKEKISTTQRSKPSKTVRAFQSKTPTHTSTNTPTPTHTHTYTHPPTPTYTYTYTYTLTQMVRRKRLRKQPPRLPPAQLL